MSNLFLGGKSTNPEVDAIMRAFKPIAGERISYEDIAGVIGVDVSDNRFRTITNRWRKIIEKQHQVRITVEDRHFVFLTSNQALDYSRRDFHRLGRATGKMVSRVSIIDPTQLSDERKEEHLLTQREAHAFLDHVRKSTKTIAAPKPTKIANLRIAN